jgi:hypothetical protein
MALYAYTMIGPGLTPAILAAFILAGLLLITVSLLGKKPPEEKWRLFFEAQST